jgi:hypothetical protein
VNISTLQLRLENRLAIVAGIPTARISAPQYQAAFIKTYDSAVFFDDEKEASLVAEASQWNR